MPDPTDQNDQDPTDPDADRIDETAPLGRHDDSDRVEMQDLSLRELDKRLLEELLEGRNTPSNLARRTDKSKQYVWERLKELIERDLVTQPDKSIYGLTDIGQSVVENMDLVESDRQAAADHINSRF